MTALLSRLPRRLAALLGLLACAACAASPGADLDPIAQSLVIEVPEEDRDLRDPGVSEEFVPGLEAVLTAIDEHEDEIARGCLSQLFARRPQGRALELAEGFERILDGRQRIGWLDLTLEAVELPEDKGRFEVFVLVGHHGPSDLTWRPGGARLRHRHYAIDPDGHERHTTRREGVPFPEELRLPAGETPQRYPIALLQLDAPVGLLALSTSLSLEILPGEFVEEGGRHLPAQTPPSSELELVRLASHLPTAAVEPAELERYVRQGRIYVPALLERAVRIPPRGRAEALDLLTPEVARMSLIELELLVPALRWLARTSRPGGDPEGWRSWLEERRRRAAGADQPEWDRVDLPGR